MEQKNHGSPSFINIAVLLLFAIVIAVVSAVTTYFVLNSRSNEQYSADQSTPVFPPQTYVQPTSPPVETTINPTRSGWTLYANNQEGFEISYPLRFKMTKYIQSKWLEFVDQNAFYEPNSYPSYTISIEQNPQNLSIEAFAKSKNELFDLDKIKLDKPYERFNNVGVQGLQFLGYGHPSSDGSLYLKRNNNVLIITGRMSDENLFNEILSTFKFIE